MTKKEFRIQQALGFMKVYFIVASEIEIDGVRYAVHPDTYFTLWNLKDDYAVVCWIEDQLAACKADDNCRTIRRISQ